jgi:hypothetical protein
MMDKAALDFTLDLSSPLAAHSTPPPANSLNPRQLAIIPGLRKIPKNIHPLKRP